MEISRRDIGYTICSRLEEALRQIIQDRLLNIFGSEWQSQIPPRVVDKIRDKLAVLSLSEIDEPMAVLEETDLPDLMEIVCYKKTKDVFYEFFPEKNMSREVFQEKINKLYPLRIKIAHVKQVFTAFDLDLLMEITENMIPLLGRFSNELSEILTCIKTAPEKVVVKMPDSWVILDELPVSGCVNNLPTPDYTSDGGFIGRKDDLRKIEELVYSDLYRVITVTGAGGVGKTATVERFCQNILNRKKVPFSAIVWVSAKEEKLSLTGIEPIEPTFRNYVEFLNSILETFGWSDEVTSDIKQKEENVQIILRAGDKGILMVVDNLETIRDERIIEFIKAFPPPSKILITSRLGLGEVEKRYPLKEMSLNDGINLLRTVAAEKKVNTLVMLPDNVLGPYVDKMFRYPLTIKWVVGQLALGQAIDAAIGDLTSSKSEVAKFCFDHIFNNLLNDNSRMVLFALTTYDKPLTRGVLAHLTDLEIEIIDKTLRELTVASLIIPKQVQSLDTTIETTYELLPLTRNYLQSQLKANPEVSQKIEARTEAVRNLIQEADKAGRQYRFSLRDLGAETEEEKVAATLVFTAHQKYQSGDYNGAVQIYERAVQIAPNFPAIYRNWAIMESDSLYFERADELMKKASNLNPNDARIWFVWGNIEKRRDRFDKAYTYLKKALDLTKDDPHVMGALAEVEKRRNNFENADKLLRKALDSNSVQALQKRTHEIICCTSIADNLRRWTDVMEKNKFKDEERYVKLKDAYEFASKAINLSDKDKIAQETFREVTLDFACLIRRMKGFETAYPYFEKAIATSDGRARSRKINNVACYNIAWGLIEQEKREEAKRYNILGRKSLTEGSSLFEKYKELGAELEGKFMIGTLYGINEGKGFGFLEIQGQLGSSAFLHVTAITPPISTSEFETLRGRKFRFTTIPVPGKSPNAVNVRLIRT